MGRAELPRSVLITDVVTRDGLQDEAKIVSTDDKLAIITGLIDAGLRSIEVASFVHPRVVPQMADADELCSRLPRGRATYCGLVPNLRGAQRALSAGLDEIRFVVSASESHNRANVNRSVAESLEEARRIGKLISQEGGRQVAFSAGIATAFSCPFEGRIPIDHLIEVAGNLLAAGATMLSLADTTGMAAPQDVFDKVAQVRTAFSGVPVALHLHNTRGMALANAYAGLQAGVSRFDAALGGLGGCPFAPGATGNVATEDLVNMLDEMGIETGIDNSMLRNQARRLEVLMEHPLESHVLRAGRSCDLRDPSEVRPATSAT